MIATAVPKTIPSAIPARLQVVSLLDLQDKNPIALNRLKNACKHDGFFYLDLRDQKNRHIQEKSERLFAVAKDAFRLPREEKMRYIFDRFGPVKIGGYKPAGRHSGVQAGKRDGFENFLIPSNALITPTPSTPRYWPDAIESQPPLFHSSITTFHDVATTILSCLTIALNLPSSSSLESAHRINKPSTTTLAMLKYPPLSALEQSQVGHMAHTDVGSITLLFAKGSGLQVQQPDPEDENGGRWAPVEAREGCAVVNVGDSLTFLSKGILRSSLHRVVPNWKGASEEGKDEEVDRARYSLAFFLRPETDAVFEDADGTSWRSEEWHKIKYGSFSAENNEQLGSSLLTGKKGYIGLWEPEEKKRESG